MKMHYQRSKTTHRIKKIALVLLAVTAVIFFVTTPVSMPAFLSNFGHMLAKPVWNLQDSIAHRIQGVSDSFTNKQTLLHENERLILQLQTLGRELHDVHMKDRENKELRALLGRAEIEQWYIPASVIVDTNSTPYDSFIIDIGTNIGIRDGMLITTPEGGALGYIVRTLKHTAFAVRFGASGQKVNVVINASSTIHAQLTGDGAGSMRITLPRDTEVSVGDSVVLPSFVSHLVGTIVHIDLAPEGAFQTVYIESPQNIYNVRYVLVDTMHSWQSENVPDTPDEETKEGE